MARIDQYSRLLNHRISTSGQTFTIPTSDDHTDETWLSTDLYIGELGINITDDKIYMRTNNGIVQIATGTSSGSGSSASVAGPWTFASPNIQISTTYSADAITPRSGYYTDLGTTALRWKDLYLGGSSAGYTTINTNAGVVLRETTNFILSSNPTSTNNSPIEIIGTSSNNTKDRPLHLNSTNVRITGTSQRNVSIASNNVTIANGQNNVAIGAGDMSFSSGVTSSVMIGYGYGKSNLDSKTVTVGGQFAKGTLQEFLYDGKNFAKGDTISITDEVKKTNPVPGGMSVHGDKLYVACADWNGVSEIDLKSNKRTRFWETGQVPFGATVSPDGKTLLTVS